MNGNAEAAPRRHVSGRRNSLDYSRLAFVLVAAVLTLTASSASAQKHSSFEQQVEARIHALVNHVRAEHGLHALEREARLDAAADYFGGYMARTGKLDHAADGSTPAARVKQRGYVYCAIAENIGYEYSSRGFTVERLARNFVEGWMESPAHRANILDTVVTQTGLGVARNGNGEYYAAQLFGRPLVPGAKKGAACPRRS